MLEKLGSEYENNPIIRALIQIVMAPIPYGIGSAIDDALTTAINNLREKRLKVFFDELATGSRHLTPDLIREEDFLHAFFSTLKAAANSKRHEKIRLFARLLKNATALGKLGSEQLEEYLQILDDLSLRELAILVKLDSFERKHPLKLRRNTDFTDPGIYLQRADEFWQEFTTQVENDLKIPPEELIAMLSRLNRTGLYRGITGAIIGNSGDKGHLTARFGQFSEWLELQDSHLPQD